MSKFRLRDIEAVQWNKPGDHSAVCSLTLKTYCPRCGHHNMHGEVMLGCTITEVCPGDWIVEVWNGHIVIQKHAFNFLYTPTDQPVYDSQT